MARSIQVARPWYQSKDKRHLPFLHSGKDREDRCMPCHRPLQNKPGLSPTISSPGSQAGCRGTGAAQATLLLKRRDRLRLAAGLRGKGGTDWRPRTSQRRRAPS